LTILIIAHRLTSIQNANNLLFIESREKISPYKKGTPQYEEAFAKLRNLTYAYGEGVEEEVELERMQSIHEESVMMRSSN
jgi:hypothetical protein